MFEGRSVLAYRNIEVAVLKRLMLLNRAASLQDLASMRSNHLEKLLGNRAGQYRIRINDQYRLCFKWQDNDALDVEMVDYH
jgi:proteic killer suppression protein